MVTLRDSLHSIAYLGVSSIGEVVALVRMTGMYCFVTKKLTYYVMLLLQPVRI